MSNRLQIKPLIENYMDALDDSEHAISQITGHVTIKKEEEYLSKTKELQVTLIDDKKMKDDLMDKVNEDKSLDSGVEEKINKLEEGINEAESIMTEMKDKLDEYETITKNIEKDLLYMDSYIRNDFTLKFQNLYKNRMSGHILLKLGELLTKSEKLDRIIDNLPYFDSVLSRAFNYVEVNGTVNNYNTVNIHNENKRLVNTLVDRSDYDKFVTELYGKYNALKSKYNLTGSYTITGMK